MSTNAVSSAAISSQAASYSTNSTSVQNGSGYKHISSFGSSVHSPKAADGNGLFDEKLKSTESMDKNTTNLFSYNAGFEETAGEMASAVNPKKAGFEESAGEIASLFSTSSVGFEEESAGEVASIFDGNGSNNFFNQALMGPKPRFEIAA